MDAMDRIIEDLTAWQDSLVKILKTPFYLRHARLRKIRLWLWAMRGR
jgi:hypothetical protein